MTGCWLARELHRLKASTVMDLGNTFCHISVWGGGRKKTGLVDQT